MQLLIKALGIGVAVIAAVLAVGALLLWLLFDPNDYRDDLAALVEERTGREFAIEDDLTLTFFPWLGVETGGLHLGNAAGFGDADFAIASSVVMRVRLLPLFRGRLEIGTVVLDGLELNLARNAGGMNNWSDLLDSSGAGAAPGASAAAEAPDTGESFFSEFDIAGIVVDNGAIFWRENSTEVRYIVSELSLRTGPIAPGTPVDAALNLQLVSVDPAFTARIDGRAAVMRDAAMPGYRAEGLQVEFRFEDGQRDERATGRLGANIEYDSTARTVRLGEVEVESALIDAPAGPERYGVAFVSPTVVLDVAAGTAQVPEAVVTVDGTEARVAFTADRLRENPRFTGTVNLAAAPVAQVFEFLGIEPPTEADLGDFELESGVVLEPADGRLMLVDLEGALLDMALTGNIAFDDLEVAGTLEAPAFDPGVLLSVLPPELTAGIDVTAVDQLAITADFTADRTSGDISLRELTAAVPGATVIGTVDRLENGNRLRGRVATTDLDPGVLAAIAPDLLPEGLDPEQLGALTFNTAFDYGATASELRLEDFYAQAFGLQSTGDLTIRDPMNALEISGMLQFEPFSPRRLLERFGRNVPATADPEVLGNARLSAEVTVSDGRAVFDSVSMRLDDTTITGRVVMEGLAEPSYGFDLVMDRIDLDRYLPPTPGETPGPAATGSGFNSGAFATLSLEGRVSAAEVQVSGLSLEEFSTAILVGDGIARVEPFLARLYGGDVRGAVELDARAGGPILSLEGSADAVDVEPLMTALSGAPGLTGSGTFDVELTGTGGRMDDVLSTALGSIEFTLRDGAIRGFNLDHALCDVYNRLQDYPRPAPATVDATPYRTLRGTAQVIDGIAQTANLLAESTSITVSGGGRMDLVTWGIDYDLDAELTAGIPIPGCEPLDGVVGESIPLTVSGTLTQPQVLPDFGELLRRRLQEGIEGALLDQLEGLLN